MHAGQLLDDGFGFFGGEDSWQVARFAGTEGIDAVIEGDLADVAVEEEESAEGLVLGGGGNVVDRGEVGQKGFDFGDTHVLGMTLVVKEDVAANPLDVGFCCPLGIMLEPNGTTDLVEQFFLGWGCHTYLVTRTSYTP
jgi:hypothetical protein